MRTIIIAITLMLVPQASADIVADRDAIDRWIREGQFDQATLFCREQISAASGRIGVQAAYTAELVRVLTEQARLLRSGEADDIWDEALAIGDRFGTRHLVHPQALLVTFQTALAKNQRIETIVRTESVMATTRDDALRAIREAIRRWDAVASIIDSRLRAGGAGQGAPAQALGTNTLRSLRDRVRHAKARSLLTRAALYSSGSDDRLLACRQAIELLEQIAPNNMAGEWAGTRVDLVRALRLRGDASAVRQETDRLLQGAKLPRCVQQSLHAERLRVAVATRDWRTVEGLLVDRSKVAQRDNEPDCPEWAVAQLEGLLAIGSRGSGSTDRSAWNTKAREQLARITSQYGPYWSRVAEATVSRARPEPGAEGSRMLTDLANVRLRQGDVAGAIKALQQSAESAEASGAHEDAWRLKLEGAKLQLQAKQFRNAIVAFAQLSTSEHAPTEPNGASAAEGAQMLAIKTAAQALRGGQTTVDVYRSHLVTFLARWPKSTDGGQVRLWLGRLHLAERDFAAAVNQL